MRAWVLSEQRGWVAFKRAAHPFALKSQGKRQKIRERAEAGRGTDSGVSIHCPIDLAIPVDVLPPQGTPEPVDIIATVAEPILRLRQIAEQRYRTDVIADAPRGHEEAQGATVRIRDSVSFGAQATFGVRDQPPETPLNPPTD